MKRSFWAMTVLALAVLVFAGCQSNKSRAQKLYDAGQYDQVIARYGSDPNSADIVQKSREKIADGLVEAGRYEAVLDSYPNTPAADKARDKMAEGLYQQRRYQEIIDRFPNTDWARKARDAMASDTTGGRVAPGGAGAPGAPGTGPGGTGTQGGMREQAAQAELDRIMNIKVPDLRSKALREFVANPQYAGTQAVKKAQNQLNPK